MRKIILTIISLAVISVTAGAAKSPKWAKSGRSAVCRIVAYDAEGNETGSTTGFLLGANGEGISEYDIFSNASSAVAIDMYGQSHDIMYVTGASRIYNVAKFRIAPFKGMNGLTAAAEQASADETVYIMSYSDEKKYTPSAHSLAAISNISGEYAYYTLGGGIDTTCACSPLMNSAGQVIGIVQEAYGNDTCNYAVDIRYASSLAISSALTLNGDDYRSMTFPKALPDNEDQALVYLYMNQGGDRAKYEKLLESFIRQYPDSPDGYLRKGSYLICSGDSTKYPEGRAQMDKAVQIAQDKGDALYQYASLIYSTLTSVPAVRMEGWTLDEALGKVNEAISKDSLPSYIQLQGNILYAQEKYQEALRSYQSLNRSSSASPDSYYYTSVVKDRLQYDADEIIATLDSAVNFYGRPYTSKVAPFILERATTKENLGRHREAVLDLNEYEQIIGTASLTSEFYYFREQIEIQAKMYEQALKDIERAVYLTPDDLGLNLEQASLLLRVGMTDQALPILQQLTRENPEDADCQRLLAVCMMRSDMKDEAREHLQKARDLGDGLAEELLQSLDK